MKNGIVLQNTESGPERTMKLKKLLKDLPIHQIKGSKDLNITGVCANSKLVAPGNLFIAKKGRAQDGAAFIPEAIAAGAVAILTDIYNPFIDHEIAQLIHSDVASIEGKLSAHYYQFPSTELFMAGLTGTNGKTTTSYLIKHLLDCTHNNCGLIGTIEYIIGQQRYQATRTTPDASTNQKMLREMVIQGCRSAVMEVTSHALDQERAANIDFDVGVFTNLTLDHLDYHQTMENYAEAKKKLFTALDPSKKKEQHSFPKTAIINVDSPWYAKMIEDCQANVLTYGLSANATLKAKNIILSSEKTSFALSYQGQQSLFKFPLPGQFNVYNCMAAVAVGLVRGIPLQEIAEIMSAAPSIPGRLEVVSNALNLKIYVDFAHSDNALANVLCCLRELKKRIIVVFGCGGDRDASKRPKMAEVCEQLADISIVTSDNPRTENPAEIIRQIVLGFTRRDGYVIEIDRRKAIEKAIDMAGCDDIILIAGKGHEPYQIFSHKIIEFDDRKTAAEICQQKAAKHTSTESIHKQ